MPTSPSPTFVPPEEASLRNQPATPRPAGRPPRVSVGALSAYFRDPLPLFPPRSGIAALMRAVLADALSCYRLGTGTRTRTHRLADEADAWFSSDDERWPFAFVNVCRALGLDPASIRRALRLHHDQAPLKATTKARQMVYRERPLPLR